MSASWKPARNCGYSATTFEAGDYYIGDINNVLENVEDLEEGFFTNGKHIIGVFSTGASESLYKDTLGHQYYTPTEQIGIVPLEIADTSGLSKGRVVSIKNEFKFGRTIHGTFWLEDRVNPANSFKIYVSGYPSDDEGDY
jgi:hypothetical protein